MEQCKMTELVRFPNPLALESELENNINIKQSVTAQAESHFCFSILVISQQFYNGLLDLSVICYFFPATPERGV